MRRWPWPFRRIAILCIASLMLLGEWYDGPNPRSLLDVKGNVIDSPPLCGRVETTNLDPWSSLPANWRADSFTCRQFGWAAGDLCPRPHFNPVKPPLLPFPRKQNGVNNVPSSRPAMTLHGIAVHWRTMKSGGYFPAPGRNSKRVPIMPPANRSANAPAIYTTGTTQAPPLAPYRSLR